MGKKDRQQRSHSHNKGSHKMQNNKFGKRNGKPEFSRNGRGHSQRNERSSYNKNSQNRNRQFNRKHGQQNSRSSSRKNQRGFSSGRKNQNGFRKNQEKGQKPQRQERQQRRTPKVQKNKKGGQFSQFVGKSVFKIVPEGQDANQKDKFAALNNHQDDDQYQQQIEVDENEYNPQQQQQQGQQDMDAQYENEEECQQDEQYPSNEDDNQFQGNQNQQGDQYQQQDEDQVQQQGEEQQQNQKEDADAKNQQEQEQEEGYKMDEEGEDQNVDISVINLRIQQTLQVLMNIPKLGQGKSRKYFVDKLKSYVHRYYGYNYELIDHFLNFMNPNQMIQFFEANQTQRPLTIRTNTLKARRKQLAQSLIQRGVNLDPLAEWSKVGIKIYDTKVPIGATPEYLAGYYMLQSASSFLPVLALDPQMNEKVLDMASAPGGKTSYIAQIMKNTGAIFANDLKKDRLKALQFNIFRLGITNTVITCRDGRKYPEIFPNTFDKVLLDAPCTGLGIIAKDHSIKANRVLLDLYKNSHVQKQLLLAAIDCTKVGGVIVYSTCSVSPLQNQQVINYALKKRHVKIVDIDDLVEVGEAGLTKFIDKRYHIDLRKTKRIYPHVHNMDGFYLGKLVKTANGKKQTPKQQQEEDQNQEQ